MGDLLSTPSSPDPNPNPNSISSETPKTQESKSSEQPNSTLISISSETPKTQESKSPENPNSQEPENPDQETRQDPELRQEQEGGGEGEEEEEGECAFCLFMKGGQCKDAFIEWGKCALQAEEKKDFDEKCYEVHIALKKCMEAHPDYYGHILEAEKATEKRAIDEMEKLKAEEKVAIDVEKEQEGEEVKESAGSDDRSESK